MSSSSSTKQDLAHRSEVARLLVCRCNNCYHTLPGYNVHGAGWHWLTPNIGPFCDSCWKEITTITPDLQEKLAWIRRPAACGSDRVELTAHEVRMLLSAANL